MTSPTTEELKDLLGKVTKGEWCLDDEGCVVGNGGNDPVCMIESGGITGVFKESEHDATLIALAPTLAAEVVRLREALVFYAEHHQYPNEGPWGVNSSDYGNIARQALAEK